jgi:hypothetical protein
MKRTVRECQQCSNRSSIPPGMTSKTPSSSPLLLFTAPQPADHTPDGNARNVAETQCEPLCLVFEAHSMFPHPARDAGGLPPLYGVYIHLIRLMMNEAIRGRIRLESVGAHCHGEGNSSGLLRGLVAPAGSDDATLRHGYRQHAMRPIAAMSKTMHALSGS